MCIFCDLKDQQANLGVGASSLEHQLEVERCTALSRLPCFVLVGFLGAGKTSLLNDLLASSSSAPGSFARVGVVENEAGPVSVDDRLLAKPPNREHSPVIVLSDGCVCCRVRGDLVAGLLALADWRISTEPGDEETIDSEPDTTSLRQRSEGKHVPIGSAPSDTAEKGETGLDAVIVEASGLAELRPILTSFFEKKVQARVRLAAVVAVLDAADMSRSLTDTSGKKRLHLIDNQIALADIVVVNKIDLVSQDQLAVLQARVNSRNPAAHVVCMGRAACQNASFPSASVCASFPGAPLSPARLTLTDLARMEQSSLRVARQHRDHRVTQLSASPKHGQGAPTHLHDTWGSLVLEANGVLDLDALVQWTQMLVPDTGENNTQRVYRGKGLLLTSAGWCELQLVGSHINLSGAQTPQPSQTTRRTGVGDSVLVLLGAGLDDEHKRALRIGFDNCVLSWKMRVRRSVCHFVSEALWLVATSAIEIVNGNVAKLLPGARRGLSV